ncbi:MAG TPA: VOC family protein [Verrucomicrobiae bacterium]|nr:VOC family protein [Verrucomicrobiae bacterium]
MPRKYQRKTRRRGNPPAITPHSTADAPPERPVRGVKLKTVSNFVIMVSILCLLAFLAGRTPLTAAGAAPAQKVKESAMFLGLRTGKYSARDLGKAKEWYSKILGQEPYFDQPFYVGFNVGGYELGITPDGKASPDRAEAGIAYWGVADAHAAYKRLLNAGATPFEEVQDVGDGILVGAVHDPFGNVLGVIQNPHFKAGEK